MDATETLQFNAADPLAWKERLVHGSAPEQVRLTAATREFEALLLRQYLNEAFKPLTSGGAIGGGGGNAVYGYLINEALAKGLTQSGVFGFSNLLQAQVADTAGINDEHTNDAL